MGPGWYLGWGGGRGEAGEVMGFRWLQCGSRLVAAVWVPAGAWDGVGWGGGGSGGRGEAGYYRWRRRAAVNWPSATGRIRAAQRGRDSRTAAAAAGRYQITAARLLLTVTR